MKIIEKKIHITTLGCSKNEYDSGILAGLLKQQHQQLMEDPEESDIIIINTCGFIGPAKEETVEAVLEAVELKKQGVVEKIIVFGCMVVRYLKELQQEIPEVDFYFGTEAYSQILKSLQLTPPQNPGEYYKSRHIELPAHSAYLKLAEGCNHQCSFCAIPLMRGQHKSRTMASIIAEARLLADKGIKELILISQDSTYYGIDLYGKQKLPELVKKLEEIERVQWIRLHYFYPTTVPEELIELMATSKKIVPYIDIPLQHVSDNMLKRMKRGGSKEKIIDLLTSFREKIPDVAIRTSFIVGFPGETEADFLELKQFIQDFRFDRLGVFIYSAEEGTAAFEFGDTVEEEIKTNRYSELMEIQRDISLENNLKKIGQVCDVIIDAKLDNENLWVGRTYADSPEIDNEVILSNINKHGSVNIGDIIPVRITDAAEYELYAKKED